MSESDVKELQAPPPKKRKLASMKSSLQHPSNSHLNVTSPTQTQWTPQSPSPSPPPILRPKSTCTPAIDDEYDSAYDSDVSGILFLPDTSTLHHYPRHHDDILSDSDLDIEIVLHRSTTTTATITTKRSPSPPWGRSPSPPPSTCFHKPTRKKSRWDDAAAAAAASGNGSGVTSSTSAVLHSALLHSINIQQKKQQKVEPLLLDEHGNPLTSHGELNNTTGVTNDSLGVDGEAGAAHAMEAATADAADSDADTDEFWDDSIQVKPAQRASRRKALQFSEQGAYDHNLHNGGGGGVGENQMKLNDDEGLEWLDPVPLVEWWDAPLLAEHDYSAAYKKAMITDLIENPRILRPELLREGIVTSTATSAAVAGNNDATVEDGSSTVATGGGAAAIPWMLTKKERKKMKRMKKKEEHQRRTDEIRLGLREAPAPRLKLSNLYRVLGAAATRDPTAAETIARNQMWIRQMKHELHNTTSQLTPAQRRDKKRRKLMEDTSKEVHVCVFVVYQLFGTLNKTKVFLNATQFNLTGALIMLNTMRDEEKDGGDGDGDGKKMVEKKEYEAEDMEDDDEDGDLDLGLDFDGKKDLKLNCKKIGLDKDGKLSLNMIVVEGGPKGIAKYQRLLQHRIKWNNVQNNCCKIWQGTVAKRTFQKFHQIKMNTEIELKKFLKFHMASSYWDMVKNSPSVTCINI